MGTAGGSDAARDLLAAADLIAPDLIWAELGNVIWRRRRQGEFDARTARAMLADLSSLEIGNHPVKPLLATALDMAMSIQHGLHDCVYLALAEQRNAVVVTADRRFHRVVSRSFWADRIAWIEDAP